MLPDKIPPESDYGVAEILGKRNPNDCRMIVMGTPTFAMCKEVAARGSMGQPAGAFHEK
jgi:hypothetical protein